MELTVYLQFLTLLFLDRSVSGGEKAEEYSEASVSCADRNRISIEKAMEELKTEADFRDRNILQPQGSTGRPS